MVEQACSTCSGQRLKSDSLSVVIGGKGIGEVVERSVDSALEFFQVDYH